MATGPPCFWQWPRCFLTLSYTALVRSNLLCLVCNQPKLDWPKIEASARREFHFKAAEKPCAHETVAPLFSMRSGEAKPIEFLHKPGHHKPRKLCAACGVKWEFGYSRRLRKIALDNVVVPIFLEVCRLAPLFPVATCLRQVSTGAPDRCAVVHVYLVRVDTFHDFVSVPLPSCCCG